MANLRGLSLNTRVCKLYFCVYVEVSICSGDSAFCWWILVNMYVAQSHIQRCTSERSCFCLFLALSSLFFLKSDIVRTCTLQRHSFFEDPVFTSMPGELSSAIQVSVVVSLVCWALLAPLVCPLIFLTFCPRFTDTVLFTRSPVRPRSTNRHWPTTVGQNIRLLWEQTDFDFTVG